ncbi:hypothetical protein [Caryophanon tenue]|uniref:N-acetyltransferase domain-containing protein n=1 Tax=Caryophanon tenue TaxID=33978 RepID=A0A1C0YIF4_9BACL|nr:hypothetical protein [Caryophanon tenue]OCS86947.1 hypothetical protein A6M13_12160 [Caryophanon tenue]
MTTTYTYEILTLEDPTLIHQTAVCLGKAFVGIEVENKVIKEPMISYSGLTFEDFSNFSQQYLEENVQQGYCAVALNEQREVVGVLAADINQVEVHGDYAFEGSFQRMNYVMEALEEIDSLFIEDYKKRYGHVPQAGEVLHIFLLGTIAEHGRHEIVQALGDLLIEKATANGMKMVIAEATNPKSLRVFEKYHQMTKYVDVNGNYLVHNYATSEHFSMIPEDVADGVYIIARQLQSE